MKDIGPLKDRTVASTWSLACAVCQNEFPFEPRVFGCSVCRERGILSVLETRFRPADIPLSPWNRGDRTGLQRYLDLLPGVDNKTWISLGEGGTAIIPSRHVGPQLGLRNLYFKNETTNPTWSFKDRYSAVTINTAHSFGFRRVVVSSTGNLGASAAAYAAASGMECLFIASEEAPASQLQQALVYGARVAIVPQERRLELFEAIAKRPGWFPVGLFIERDVQNPFGIEGYKTFAYEMLEALSEPPQMVLFPCARGNGLYGAWKGFQEAVTWKWVTVPPKMVACQPSAANSLEVSLRAGADKAIPVAARAASIAVSTFEQVSSTHALRAIRESGGTALSAEDGEIIKAMDLLGREGLCVEASSALTVACLPSLVAGLNQKDTRPIVCVLTGSGMKWAPDLERHNRTIARFPVISRSDFLSWAEAESSSGIAR